MSWHPGLQGEIEDVLSVLTGVPHIDDFASGYIVRHEGVDTTVKDAHYYARRRSWINRYYATNEAYRERKKLLERQRRLMKKLQKEATLVACEPC